MKKRNQPFPIAVVSILILILTLVLSGCGTGLSKGMKPSQDWSRGASVGRAANGTIGLAVEDAGERVHLAWPSDTEGGTRIRYLQMDSAVNFVVDRELDLSAGQLRTPRLLPSPNGNLHFFWASRLPDEKQWGLWYALLSQDGILLTKAARLSDEIEQFSSYSFAPDDAGGVIVVWDRGDMGGMYGVRLTSAGEMAHDPRLITPQGEMPDVRVDAQGGLHIIWFDKGSFLYAHQSDGILEAAGGIQVAEANVGTSDSLTNPVLGLSDGWVYLFWSLLSRAGLEAGTARVEFVAFPSDAPGKSTPSRLPIMPLEEQPYQSYQGGFSLTQLVPPAAIQLNSDFAYQPVTIQEQGEQLAVALAVTQQYRQDSHVQIAMAIFDEGQYQGYAMASKTTALSGYPILIADDADNLHLAWRDGAVGQRIYYATTAAEARSVLDRINFEDIVNALLQGGMEGLVGVMLVPIVGFGWLLPGLVVMVLWKLFRDHESLRETISWVVLIIAIAIYQGVKFVSLPGITTYTPFSAWLDIPAGWHSPLRIGIPVLILGIAVFIAERVRRQRSSSSLTYYFALALTDAILTLAVYGVIFLGVY